MDWAISSLVFTPSELSIHFAKQNKKLDKIRKEMTRQNEHLAALKESDAKQKADLASQKILLAELRAKIDAVFEKIGWWRRFDKVLYGMCDNTE